LRAAQPPNRLLPHLPLPAFPCLSAHMRHLITTFAHPPPHTPATFPHPSQCTHGGLHIFRKAAGPFPFIYIWVWFCAQAGGPGHYYLHLHTPHTGAPPHLSYRRLHPASALACLPSHPLTTTLYRITLATCRLSPAPTYDTGRLPPPRRHTYTPMTATFLPHTSAPFSYVDAFVTFLLLINYTLFLNAHAGEHVLHAHAAHARCAGPGCTRCVHLPYQVLRSHYIWTTFIFTHTRLLPHIHTHLLKSLLHYTLATFCTALPMPPPHTCRRAQHSPHTHCSSSPTSFSSYRPLWPTHLHCLPTESTFSTACYADAPLRLPAGGRHAAHGRLTLLPRSATALPRHLTTACRAEHTPVAPASDGLAEVVRLVHGCHAPAPLQPATRTPITTHCRTHLPHFSPPRYSATILARLAFLRRARRLHTLYVAPLTLYAAACGCIYTHTHCTRCVGALDLPAAIRTPTKNSIPPRAYHQK